MLKKLPYRILNSRYYKKTSYYAATLYGLTLVYLSGLFDSKYYLRQNKDVREAGVNPLWHFSFHGGLEGRNPGPDFHSGYYLSQYPDVRISGLNPLIHYLLYGKARGWQCQISGRDFSFSFRKYQISGFRQQVSVVIPVYIQNKLSLKVFGQLVESLKFSYPEPGPLLKFHFIDDHSPGHLAADFYKSNDFFQRSDVFLTFNNYNKGFAEAINVGFELSGTHSDVVILNSDTRIYPKVFEILQDVVLRDDKIASVTPLSNKATIASLSNWPWGDEHIKDYTHDEIAEIITDLGLINPNYPVPTGHGFCMYITRKALELAGGFDQVTFGKGYGEENDWCQRALQKGMIHLITTETYVYHHDTASFTSDEKQKLISKNIKVLEKLYPYYRGAVNSYIQTDPLKLHRAVIKIKLTEVIKKRNKYYTIAYFLHSDPFSFKGGTEVHVMDLVKAVLQYSDKYEIFVFYPEADGKNSSVSLRYFNKETKYNLDIWFFGHQFESLLSYFASRIDFFHVHHFLGWNKQVLDWLKSVGVKQKVLTLHDFRAFCINPNLVFSDGRYCVSKHNINECLKCFEKTGDESRKRNIEFLSGMDKILVPSVNTKDTIHELADSDSLRNKLTVFPHFLPFSHFNNDSDKIDRSDANLIVFLGGASDVKGIQQFLAARLEFEKQGFKCEIWGHSSQFTINVKTRPYKGYPELAEREYQPYVVFLPSVWPETFSYTLFEALFILKAPVIVGPYGNPAEFVKKHNVGIVMSGIGASFLIGALDEMKKEYSFYRENVNTTINSLAAEYHVGRYMERYFKLFHSSADLDENTVIQ